MFVPSSLSLHTWFFVRSAPPALLLVGSFFRLFDRFLIFWYCWLVDYASCFERNCFFLDKSRHRKT